MSGFKLDFITLIEASRISTFLKGFVFTFHHLFLVYLCGVFGGGFLTKIPQKEIIHAKVKHGPVTDFKFKFGLLT